MSTSRGQARAVVAYTAMLLGAVALFLLIRSYGESLSPPVAALSGATGPAPATSDVLWHLLLALTAVIVAGRCLGVLFRHIGQPPVIGEVVAGILLGPSLLGRVTPGAYLYLLPPEIAPFLSVLAQLGVIVYMFLVGLELNSDLLRGQVHASVATSHASIVLPFILGSALALYLYPVMAPGDVPFTHFALFLGIAMSITAFPVLARILADQGMTGSRLGVLALTCAAVDDVTAWCLLAFVVGVVHATGERALLVAVLTVSFIAVVFLAVRPFFKRLVASPAGMRPTQGAFPIALIAMLASALVTEAIGVHAIFGAFLLCGDPERQRAGAVAETERRARGRAVPARVLRFHRNAHRDEPRVRRLRMVDLRADCVRCHGREVRRHRGGRTGQRAGLASCCRTRRPDEHARSHGADRAQRRPGPRRDLADAVHDDGADGACDNGGDDADSAEARAGAIGTEKGSGVFFRPRVSKKKTPDPFFRLARRIYLAAAAGLANLESSIGTFTCTSLISYTRMLSRGPLVVQREGILTPLTGQ